MGLTFFSCQVPSIDCASAGPASEAWPLPLDGTGCDPVQAGNAPGRFYA